MSTSIVDCLSHSVRTNEWKQCMCDAPTVSSRFSSGYFGMCDRQVSLHCVIKAIAQCASTDRSDYPVCHSDEYSAHVDDTLRRIKPSSALYSWRSFSCDAQLDTELLPGCCVHPCSLASAFNPIDEILCVMILSVSLLLLLLSFACICFCDRLNLDAKQLSKVSKIFVQFPTD